MSYWMEDYESGESYLGENFTPIVNRCTEIINRNKFVRVGFVILNEFKLIHASKNDLVQVLAALEETGKYQSRTIRHKSGTDFIVTKLPKKSWKERNWIIADAIKVAIGAVIGFLISLLLHI